MTSVTIYRARWGAGLCLPLILQLVSLPSITLQRIFVDSGTQAPSNQCPLSLPLGLLHPARKDTESGASSGPSSQGWKWHQSLPLAPLAKISSWSCSDARGLGTRSTSAREEEKTDAGKLQKSVPCSNSVTRYLGKLLDFSDS